MIFEIKRAPWWADTLEPKTATDMNITLDAMSHFT